MLLTKKGFAVTDSGSHPPNWSSALLLVAKKEKTGRGTTRPWLPCTPDMLASEENRGGTGGGSQGFVRGVGANPAIPDPSTTPSECVMQQNGAIVLYSPSST
mmetsp:Transcript_45623/g.98826  ORF Transcript_45623/g.98826 Transcript_45623/m.98826 type:complete len:102 (-) Transcript_45623:72-377(-)